MALNSGFLHTNEGSRSFSHMLQVWRKNHIPKHTHNSPFHLPYPLCGGLKLAENSLDSKALQYFLSSLGWRDSQLPDSRRDAIVWSISRVHYLKLSRASSVLKTVWDLCSRIIRHYWMKWKMKFIHINNNLSSSQEVHFSNFSGKSVLRVVEH